MDTLDKGMIHVLGGKAYDFITLFRMMFNLKLRNLFLAEILESKTMDKKEYYKISWLWVHDITILHPFNTNIFFISKEIMIEDQGKGTCTSEHLISRMDI